MKCKDIHKDAVLAYTITKYNRNSFKNTTNTVKPMVRLSSHLAVYLFNKPEQNRKPFCFCPPFSFGLEVNNVRISGAEQPIKLEEKHYPPPAYRLKIGTHCVHVASQEKHQHRMQYYLYFLQCLQCNY